MRPDRGVVVSGIAQSGSGRRVATVGGDTRLDLWTSDGQVWSRRGGVALERRVNDRPHVAMSADGELAATANNNGGTVQLWDTADPDRPRLATTLQIATRYTFEVAFVGDRDLLATGASDRSVQLWDVSNPAVPRKIGTPLEGPADLVRSVTASPDGRRLAVASDDGRVYLYDVADGRLLHTLAIESPAAAATFDPSGRHLVVAGDDLTVWSVDDGELVDRAADDHPDTLGVLADSGTILTGTAAKDVIAYSLGDDGRLSDRRAVTPVLAGAEHHDGAVGASVRDARRRPLRDRRGRDRAAVLAVDRSGAGTSLDLRRHRPDDRVGSRDVPDRHRRRRLRRRHAE
ncbi:WD40 repeat domain-containing protein [Gordonia humi]|uniref:WD40 repeat domain-containing protein n=1 Tax=Gordonia humi TaxID=686429 RepID=UPI00360AC5CF